MERVGIVSRHLVAVPTGAVDSSVRTDDAALSSPRSAESKSPRERYSKQEWEARCQLAVAYRLAAHYEWDQLVFNHITVKAPGSETLPDGPHFLINPFGLRFDEVTASSLLKVDLDGNVVDKGTDKGPLFKQGFVVHSAVHAARPDLKCVWHCHHADTTAVSMTKVGLLPLSQEAIALTGGITYHPFEGTATDLEERERMAKSLGPKSKVLMLIDHGPITAGGSVVEAFFYMYLLTLACKWQIKAMSAVGGDLSKLHVPSGEHLQQLYQRARDSQDKKRDHVGAKSEPYNEVLAMWFAAVRVMEDKHGAANIYC